MPERSIPEKATAIIYHEGRALVAEFPIQIYEAKVAEVSIGLGECYYFPGERWEIIAIESPDVGAVGGRNGGQRADAEGVGGAGLP